MMHIPKYYEIWSRYCDSDFDDPECMGSETSIESARNAMKSLQSGGERYAYIRDSETGEIFT